MRPVTEILIVDDERVLREAWKTVLLGEGYAVRTAKDGEDALAKIDEKRPDLVLLDVMMPKLNGFRCCEEIRRRDALLPIIFLTAKDSEADQVRGIGLGGDDYVSKEAGEALLLARIERALVRTREIGQRTAGDSIIRLGRVSVDLRTFSVSEGGILKLLDSQRGEYFVADDIITELRGNGFACEDTMLYVHICNLRRKLGPASGLLATKHGVGYCLAR